MRENDFKAEYRVSRRYFWRLVQLIETHPVFSTKQRPVPYQLLVFLEVAGLSGNGSSFRRNSRLGRCSVGSVRLFTDRCVLAHRSHLKRIVSWPSLNERHDISAAFEEQHGIPGCVGAVDGTLIALAQKPSKHGEDYFSRKSSYAINAIIACDHTRRIRYVYAGWPGSCHDQRVFQNSSLAHGLGSFTSGDYFLVGDSAFSPNKHLISPFKKPPKRPIDPQHEAFNERISSLRICVEHCIGILKGRFQCLKEVRVRVNAERDTVKRCVRLVEACIVIHIYCIDDDIPEDWIDRGDDDEDEQNDTNAQRNLASQTTMSGRADTSRWNELRKYLIDRGTV
ncbi:hypothetical protein Ae201684P_016295 [Aphanomyces euteiches]|uniref:DDE Tnp4 domain-containing protein n=1 Tax=Aphanomyces euteiches TaxID=100861 RepID=A0A6G0XJH7_9STRA|nr:hypothetical protein Ae201684_004062 [Aphanomyces euteiches]KAH9093670.1 hypothetical protein Ae201684P_016295 [Aphanomyces euteiches]